MLRQPTVNSSLAQDEVDPGATTPPGHTINGSRSMFAQDMFPLVEKIKVYARTSDPIGEGEIVSVLGSFREYVVARQESGRPVEVFRKTDRELPNYYTLDGVGT